MTAAVGARLLLFLVWLCEPLAPYPGMASLCASVPVRVRGGVSSTGWQGVGRSCPGLCRVSGPAAQRSCLSGN